MMSGDGFSSHCSAWLWTQALTLAGSSVGLWLSSDTSGAVGTDTGSKGDLAFPASPREAVLTWVLGRVDPGIENTSWWK